LRHAEGSPLFRRDDEPAFAEPWQAQVMAVAAALVAAGRFTAAQWSDTLGAEIARANAAAAPDNAGTYYHCALEALERLSKEQSLTNADALAARKAEWVEAYEHTPHGQPVTLDQQRY
jgi:nitrile hydratase accessory protein